MSQHKIIANNFRVFGPKKKEFVGPVIASSDGYYLVIKGTAGQAVIAGTLGPLFGTIALKTMAETMKGRKEVYETTIQKIPATVKARWPVKLYKGRVIVVPRDAITNITYSFWGTYDLETPDATFAIALKLWGRRKVVKFLRDVGWEF